MIFDLDGVLVDSEIWWDEARRAFAREHGQAWTEDDRAAVMGANSRAWSITMRDRLGIEEVLGAIVSSDEVVTGKPAPDVYLAAAARLGADPARCLVVEDSLNGVRAGLAAGMTVVLVPNPTVPPAGNARDLAHHVVPSLAGLDPDAFETAPATD